MFEVVKKAGLSRIAKLSIEEKEMETPALLPVLHPANVDEDIRNAIKSLNVKGIITNSYIMYKNPSLRESFIEKGIHRAIGYDGIIMTDSGAFQKYVYGNIDVNDTEIFQFQLDIGVDLPTVLDEFSEPTDSYETIMQKISITEERTKKAKELAKGKLVVAPIQGGLFYDLRKSHAAKQSQYGDYMAIGGVVPLMENYKFYELANVILSSKEGLNPAKPVHLFGGGHPMMFSLAVYLGIDLFDSSSYIKYAKAHRMMFPEGTFMLESMEYNPCQCPACSAMPLKVLKKQSEEAIVKTLSLHNLYASIGEIELIKQCIKDGTLWDLVEQRVHAHPNMMGFYKALKKHMPILEYNEPLDNDSLRLYGMESLMHPVIYRNRKKILERVDIRFGGGTTPYKPSPRWDVKENIDLVKTPIGIIPNTLKWTYPYNSIIFTENPIFDDIHPLDKMVELMAEEKISGKSWEIARCSDILDFQFGKGANKLLEGNIEFVYSKNTGRLRMVKKDGKHILSLRNSGYFSLKIEGAILLNAIMPENGYTVVISDDAVPFVSEGKNVFSKFVLKASESIRPNDEVIILNQEKKVIACGIAKITPLEMRSFKKGIAVEVKESIN